MTVFTLSVILIAAVTALIVFFFLHGWKKGVLRLLFTTFSFVITILLASVLTEPLSDWLTEKTFIGEAVESKVSDYVDSKMEAYIEDTQETLSEEAQGTIINSLTIPRILKNSLADSNTLENYISLQVENFSDYLKLQLSTFFMRLITFLVLTILIHIAIRIILRLIRVLEKIPVLRGINKVLGAVVGLIEAFIIIWIAGLIVSVLAGTAAFSFALEAIYSNSVLTFLYENNLILALLSGVFTAI